MAGQPKFENLMDVWNVMTREERRQAAESFWQTANLEEQVQAEHYLAERLHFRPRSVHQLPLARRAEYVAALLVPVVPAYLESVLVAYHLGHKRDMMAAFLDQLGIPNERGEIKSDGPVTPPSAEALQAARAALLERFPEHDVEVYLGSLALLDPDTWAALSQTYPSN